MKVLVQIARFLEIVAFAMTAFYIYQFGLTATSEVQWYESIALFVVNMITLFVFPFVLACATVWKNNYKNGFYMTWSSLLFWGHYFFSVFVLHRPVLRPLEFWILIIVAVIFKIISTAASWEGFKRPKPA